MKIHMANPDGETNASTESQSSRYKRENCRLSGHKQRDEPVGRT